MKLTSKQQLHRQYLKSPVWEEKRRQAIEFYGCICNRCGNWGNDVHHKTYDRVGGSETMQDLEILCRGCHEAHHRVERVTKQKCRRKNNGINRAALALYLTPNQREILKAKFRISWQDIYIAIIEGSNSEITHDALKMLSKRYAVRSSKHASIAGVHGFSPRHHAKLMT